jgi:probable phosphoglycerate mutase
MDLIVTIVRHGDTFDADEPPRRIGARTDLPLVASGIRQAQALGVTFAERGLAFDRALTAPLRRTRGTVERILAQQPQAPSVEMAEWLIEIDHGPDEGQLERCVTARIGSSALSGWDTDAQAPDGWVINADRRIEGWRGLWRTGHGRVLIVTSNGAARFALLSDGTLREQASRLPSLKLRTGAYGVIGRERGILSMVAWDQRP